MNPGCQLFIQGYRNSDDNEGSESSGLDLGTSMGACLVIGGIILFLYALPFILAIGAIGLIGWGVYKLLKWLWNQK